MEVLYGPDFKIKEKTVVTIGKFDGIHIGHKKVFEELITVSKDNKLKSVVYTFIENPKLVLHQEEFMPLMTNEEKTKAIENFGVDYLVYEDFSENFSKMEPEEFVREVLINRLSVNIVVMGANSTFGINKSGNIETMKMLGVKYNFEVKIVDMILTMAKWLVVVD